MVEHTWHTQHSILIKVFYLTSHLNPPYSLIATKEKQSKRNKSVREKRHTQFLPMVFMFLTNINFLKTCWVSYD